MFLVAACADRSHPDGGVAVADEPGVFRFTCPAAPAIASSGQEIEGWELWTRRPEVGFRRWTAGQSISHYGTYDTATEITCLQTSVAGDAELIALRVVEGFFACSFERTDAALDCRSTGDPRRALFTLFGYSVGNR